ncbi:MAG: NAD-dependent epimerase/dehydratase family protein [Planctomycetes bacterium]|nr:NAD-dependent epimerase/dehydratase family protein [Planctomycetota bacterium]
MHYFVTGGAGFIGSNLVDRLLADGHAVTAYDNFSTGQREFLAGALRHSAFRLIEGDLLDLPVLTRALAGHDFVFHLAANADVRFGTHHPRKDLEQNTIATFHVLEAMRANGVRRLAFSSTGSIYGEPEVFPTPESCPFPVQTSLYGASKLAGEGLIAAYCTGFDFQGFLFRFVSILGERYTHGHVYDFYNKLLDNPHEIEVLGNGKQRKSYLHVQDCIDAMLLVIQRSQRPVTIANLGTDEYCCVNDSLDWICAHLGVNPRRYYTGGERGWIGDSPFIFLDTSFVGSFGWRPKLSIRAGILRTLEYLQANPWVLRRRHIAA